MAVSAQDQVTVLEHQAGLLDRWPALVRIPSFAAACLCLQGSWELLIELGKPERDRSTRLMVAVWHEPGSSYFQVRGGSGFSNG